MIPNKELNELAQAIKRSVEYSEMLRLRRRMMEHPRYGRQAMMFEREYARLHTPGLQEAEYMHRQRRLYAEYKELFEQQEVKKFIEAAHTYQRLITDCLAYLHRNLDVNRAY